MFAAIRVEEREETSDLQVFWHTAHDEYVFSLGRRCCRSRNEKNEGNGSESY